MNRTLNAALQAADQPSARERLAAFLVDLMGVETTVGPGLDRVRANERQVFERIAREVERVRGSRQGLERVPISPLIKDHPYYTPCHYTRTDERAAPLGPAEAYRDRANLVLRVPGQGRGVLAFNAHVDVVKPYVPPRLEEGVVHGRGACDDKGQCAALVLALQLIERARREGLEPPADLLFEFVIDEEPGGNGSLSLALDTRFAFDAMVILEPTSLAVHPGNRGAVWYRLELDGRQAPGLDLVGLAAACVLALEDEGAAIKAESDHPLFPHRPVQTCHGVLGPWGTHPSAVNDQVEVAVRFAEPPPRDRLAATVDQAVADYCRVYGDKTREPDPDTGQPKVDHHVDLRGEGATARLVVHGKAGHMGATAQCDNAITKAASIVQALEADEGLAVRGFSVGQDGPLLVLEGGQGFLPTHRLEDVTERMRKAVARATEAHAARHGAAAGPALATMSFEKLHNDAFARDPQDPSVRAFVEAVRSAGIAVEEPLRGWDVSCDARLFAREAPESAVLTFGAGSLHHAHALDEQVRLDDVAAAARAVARFALTHGPSHRGQPACP